MIEFSKSIDELVNDLQNGDKPLKLSSLKELNYLFALEAIPALIQALKDKDSEVRVVTAEVLGEMADPRALWDLVIALEIDNEPLVRANAAFALGEIRDTVAVPSLLKGLEDSDVNVCIKSADAMRKMPKLDIQAISGLLKALENDNDYVQKYALEAFNLINPSIIPLKATNIFANFLQNSEEKLRHESARLIIEVVKSQKDFSIESRLVLIKVFEQSDDKYSRFDAIRLMGQQKDPTNNAILVKALKDECDWVRAQAIKGLYDIVNSNPSDDLDIIPLVIEAVGKECLVDESAIADLIKIEYPIAIAASCRGLEKGEIFPDLESIKNISEKILVPELIPTLRKMLSQKRWSFWYKSNIVEVIGKIPDKRSKPILERFLEENKVYKSSWSYKRIIDTLEELK